jgi:hypothetical protein
LALDYVLTALKPGKGADPVNVRNCRPVAAVRERPEAGIDNWREEAG